MAGNGGRHGRRSVLLLSGAGLAATAQGLSSATDLMHGSSAKLLLAAVSGAVTGAAVLVGGSSAPSQEKKLVQVSVKVATRAA
jgi:hypothetical protein